MKFKFVLGVLFLFSALHSQGQDLEPDPLEAYLIKKRGPNKDHYGHLFLGYGFIVGPSEGDSAEIRPGKSSSFDLGWRSKWRLSSWYELGFDVSYHYSSYHLRQDSLKKVPNSVLHKKEKLVFNSLDVSPFQRFKLKNKDHSTGIFIDVGGFLGYYYRVKHQTLESNQVSGAGSTKTINLNLKYTEDFDYGAFVRLGFNRIVFYGRYRFSDLFTASSQLPELPRFQIGLQLGIHQ